MKSPAHLEVLWHDGSRVGFLVNRGTIYFAYDEPWLATGYNLSPLSLPFSNRPFNGARGIEGLPGLIFDCLPDEFGRKLARRDFAQSKLGEPSTMELLAWRGGRGIGALQFKPAMHNEGASAGGRLESVVLAALARGALQIDRGEPSEVLRQLRRGGTAGGAYPKALVLAHPDGSLSVGEPDATTVPFVVKFGAPERIGASQCEHAYAKLAALAGIRTSVTRVVSDGALHHLMVRRFDVPESGHGRYHCHTVSGLLHKEPRKLDYGDVFRAIIRMGLPREEIYEWARRATFNLLASNIDDHGKNHSLLYDPAGGWRLSPAYDMGFGESMIDRGMSIAGEVWPSLTSLTELFVSASLPPADCRNLIDQVAGAVAKWPHVAAECGVPKNLALLVHERIGRVHQAVFPKVIPVAVKLAPPPGKEVSGQNDVQAASKGRKSGKRRPRK